MRPLARLTITMMSSRITVPTVTVVGRGVLARRPATLQAGRVMDPDQMGLISSRLRPVVRGPINAMTAIVAASAATTTVNIAAAP